MKFIGQNSKCSLFKKETVNKSIDLLKKSPKQKEILLHIISEIKSNSYLKIKDLKDRIKFSDNSLKGLEEKGSYQ